MSLRFTISDLRFTGPWPNPARGDLFLARAPIQSFFCFSAARRMRGLGNRDRLTSLAAHARSLPPAAPLKNKKFMGVGVFYKQVTPSGVKRGRAVARGSGGRR